MFNPNDFTILVDNGQYGTYGTVKRDEEKKFCHKVIDKKTALSTSVDILKKIKRLNIHNVYKLYDINYSVCHGQKFLQGYFMDYYEPARITTQDVHRKRGIDNHLPLIYFPIEYIKINYYALKDTFEQLYKNNIGVNDLHYLNVIFTERDIVLIDVDNYYKINPIKKIVGKTKVYNVNTFFFETMHEEVLLYMSDDIGLFDFVTFMESIDKDFIDKIDGYSNLHDFLIDNIKGKNWYNDRKRLLK